MGLMTAKEALHRLIDELTLEEAEKLISRVSLGVMPFKDRAEWDEFALAQFAAFFDSEEVEYSEEDVPGRTR